MILTQQLRLRAQAVRDRFEEARSALYRADGTHEYADAEHNERPAALHATRNAALREIDAEAASVIARAQAFITALENGDVTALLTGCQPRLPWPVRGNVARMVARLCVARLGTRPGYQHPPHTRPGYMGT